MWKRVLGGKRPEAAPQTSASVEPENRRVRVFISSTFRDMVEERNELMNQAWPELRRFCRELQVEFVEVDLRWGISEEQSSRKETLKLCLDEIRTCRPFFIGLLGERYGWVPGGDTFSPDLEEEQPWVKELRDRSVTELEILHGVLRDPEMAGRAFFYFRDPAYAAGRGPDFADETPAAGRQAALKERVRAVCREKGIPLRENYPGPRALAELVQADLRAAIDAEYPLQSIPDPLAREARDHEAFATTRRRTYIGRQEYIDALDHHAEAQGGPLVVLGESGSGKSALLANWLYGWRQAHPGDFTFQHYLGGTPGSADHWGLLSRLLAEIKRRTGDPAELPKSHDDTVKDLAVWLAKLRARAEHDGVRAIVVLDALNQLEDRDGARRLGWLPEGPFSGALRLIVSTLPGDTLEPVEKRGWASLRVQPLTVDQRQRMIVDYLARFSKKLDAPRIERIAASPGAANPLYLKVLLDELRVTGTHERLDERLDDYLSARDIPALLDKILARYESAYERDRPGLVGETLGLIQAARRGLSEPELLALLRPADLPKLPPAVWAPLRAALDESLVDRGGILNFAHGFLRGAVERRYAAGEERQRALWLQLAGYFEAQPATARTCDELPWLLQRAGTHDRLRACLLDLERFVEIKRRDPQELLGYWLWLGEAEQMGPRYAAAYDEWVRATGSAAEPGRPAFVASELGLFHNYCGQYGPAEPLLRRALAEDERWLGPDHRHTLRSVNNLGLLLESKGDYAGAEPLLRRALLGAEQMLGADHLDTLTSESNLAALLSSKGDYAGAEPLHRRALAGRERALGPDHPDTLTGANNLGSALQHKGDLAGAELLFRRAVAGWERVLGPDHPDTLAGVSNLAGLLESTGDYAGAEPLYRRALAARERVLGPGHPDTLASTHNLGFLLQSKGDYAGAESLFRRALSGCERALGPDHPGTLTMVSNLAALLDMRADCVGAEPLYRRALAGRERALGPDHPATLASANNLAFLLQSKGDYAGAEPQFRRALAGYERALGPDHPDTLTSVSNLAGLLQSVGDYAGAEPLFRRALAGRERVLGSDHPDTLLSVHNLGYLLDSKGDRAGAEPLYRRALAGRERLLGADHPDTLASLNNLAGLVYRNGDCAGAEPLFRRALAGWERVLGPDHPNTLRIVNNLAVLLQSKGDHGGAEPLFRRSVAGRERALGPDHPDTLLSVHNLAVLLDSRGDYAGAERQYRRALSGLARVSAAMGRSQPYLQDVANNYIQLLRQMGKRDNEIRNRLRECGLNV